MDIKGQIESLKWEIRECGKKIRWLRAHEKTLTALPAGGFCGTRIDFDHLPHTEVIKVIRALGGKWQKTANTGAKPGETKIDYAREVDGIEVRCWAGEPPPSCRIVEVEETIPEQVIPAHTRKIKKMICTGQEPVTVAIARANNPITPAVSEPAPI